MSKTVLVTGGAGYIGSHTVWQLIEAGYKVVVVDNLTTGNAWAINSEAVFVKASIGDKQIIEAVIKEYDIKLVIHFAGSILVAESTIKPEKYYENNVVESVKFINTCVENGIEYFIYSSTAAVYGEPNNIPIPENSETKPINPYGNTKLIIEMYIKDVLPLHGINYCILRYFNVAGAREDLFLGQATPVATHLIKIAAQAAVGIRGFIEIYGTDYDTPDGTCLRDYIHVEDLASAHIAAMKHIYKSNDNQVLNCGYGYGYSVREIIEAVKKISSNKFDVRETNRRAGDPPVLIAENRLDKVLNWEPSHANIEKICKSAVEWEEKFKSLGKRK